MADLVVTAANVVQGSGASVENGTAGATLTAGQSVYKDPADNKWKLFDANSGVAEARVFGGIALNGAASGQPIAVLTAGDINVGATLVVGTIYVGSANPGGIAPAADLVTGWYVNVIGVATTAGNLRVRPNVAGIAVP